MSDDKPQGPPPHAGDRSNEPPAYTGAPPPRPAVEIDEATISLVRRMHELTPRTWVVPAIVIANVGVYVAMIAQGVHYFQPTYRDILAWGGNSSALTTNGEWWRLFTCMFLHWGLLHLALNMWALWSVGRLVERLFGNLGFAALYLGAGLCGSIASLLWNPESVSAGASGAVFGVFGSLLGIVVRMRRDLPPAFQQTLKRDAAFVIIANLIFTFSVKDIDAAAHLGGLAAGILFGLILAHPIEPGAAAARWKRAALVLLASGAIVGAGAAFAPRGRAATPIIAQEVDQLEKKAINTFHANLERMKNRELSPEGFAKILDEDILPTWRTMRAKLDQILSKLTPVAQQSAEAFKLREEAWTTYVQALRATSAEASQELFLRYLEQTKRANDMMERLNKQAKK